MQLRTQGVLSKIRSYALPLVIVSVGVLGVPSPLSIASDWTSPLSDDWKAAAEPMPVGPIDGRDFLAPDAFQKSGQGQWLSDIRRTDFAFDELIYSWSVRLPEGRGFRLYLKAGFAGGDSTPWIYAGYWGEVNQVEGRESPRFEQGRLAMDQLLLNRKARTYQFKLVSEGPKPLSLKPGLHVVYTDNRPRQSVWRKYARQTPGKRLPAKVFDLPLRAQRDTKGKYLSGRCQSAALASAMEYLGKAVPLEEIISYTYDPEYSYPGIWPRTIGAAIEHGFDAYIDRFRDWDAVRAALAENKVILCSILMPKEGDYINPPYSSMTGHIVTLNGVTDDGRVVVTDSALVRSGRGYQCQWLEQDFEKIWMGTKGGVGMVICPPEGFQEKVVEDLPEFPDHRAIRQARQKSS